MESSNASAPRDPMEGSSAALRGVREEPNNLLATHRERYAERCSDGYECKIGSAQSACRMWPERQPRTSFSEQLWSEVGISYCYRGILENPDLVPRSLFSTFEMCSRNKGPQGQAMKLSSFTAVCLFPWPVLQCQGPGTAEIPEPNMGDGRDRYRHDMGCPNGAVVSSGTREFGCGSCQVLRQDISDSDIADEIWPLT
jgi:hypothetical protein